MADDALAAVEAKLALHQLVADYCLELDTTAGLEATALLTEDCRIDLGAMQLADHAEIRAFYEAFAARVAATGAGGRTTRHVATNFRIALTGRDEARVDLTMLNFSGLGAAPVGSGTVPSILSDVRLRCRRAGDGRWRIAELGGAPVFIGADPLQNDVLKGADGDAGERSLK